MSSFSHYNVGNDLQTPIMRDTTDVLPDTYLESLEKNLQIKILSLTEEDIVFDLIGVEAPVANALRRILLAEVPTIAIENVWIQSNTSIIQDEVLAHRVGLIPLKIDPRKLSYVKDDEETDNDTIVLHLDVACPQPAPGTYDDPDNTHLVLSSQLRWLPQGNQTERFPEGVKAVHDDIVIAKLKPGQRIEFEAHCRKGIGKDHTKFSPVATASYRLLPHIVLPEPVTGELAKELQTKCPMKVFDIEDLGGTPTAKVARPRDCTMCRECIRTEGWSDRVQLKRVADHFIFTVESSGCIPPEDIVVEAINVLREKARQFQGIVGELTSAGPAVDGIDAASTKRSKQKTAKSK